jgi:hypothetical protein
MALIVAAVILLIGMGVAVAFYLARRDPLTRNLNLGGAGLFMLGRTSLRPRRDDNGNADTVNSSRSGRRGDDADDRAPPEKQP